MKPILRFSKFYYPESKLIAIFTRNLMYFTFPVRSNQSCLIST